MTNDELIDLADLVQNHDPDECTKTGCYTCHKIGRLRQMEFPPDTPLPSIPFEKRLELTKKLRGLINFGYDTIMIMDQFNVENPIYNLAPAFIFDVNHIESLLHTCHLTDLYNNSTKKVS